MKSKYDDMTVGEYLKNPPKVAEPNDFSDFKKYPGWGRPSIKDEDHPWYAFFQEKFDCTGFYKNPKAWGDSNDPDVPINLYSSHRDCVKKQFLDFVQDYPGFSDCSDFFKEVLAHQYKVCVSNANWNPGKMKFHNGRNNSRGSVGTFIDNVCMYITARPEMMTPKDCEFLFKYVFFITESEKIKVLKTFLTA